MPELLITLLTIGVVVGAIPGVCNYLILLERKLSAWMQDRIGPNRVGPMGLFQPLADGVAARGRDAADRSASGERRARPVAGGARAAHAAGNTGSFMVRVSRFCESVVFPVAIHATCTQPNTN